MARDGTERTIPIRYGWVNRPVDTSLWEGEIYRVWGVLIVILIIIALRIFSFIAFALGITVASVILCAAISLTMIPRTRSIDVYVDPDTSIEIRELVLSGPHSVIFLVGAFITYTLAFAFTFLMIPLLSAAAFLNFMYIYPFAKMKTLEDIALKNGFPITDNKGEKLAEIKVGSEGRYRLEVDGEEVNLGYNEAKFLYDLSLRGSKENRAIKKFIALKKGFTKGEWAVTPTPNPYIYIMIKKDFSSFVNISGPNASALLTGTSPEDLLDRINRLSDEVSVYRKFMLNVKNVQFAGTSAVIEIRNRTLVMDMESGRVYSRKRFICLIAGREYGAYSTDMRLKELREGYGLDERRLEILSKIYHLATEESKVIRLIK